MLKSPSQLDTSQNVFKPKELKTPVKDLPGVSKLLYTHCSKFHNLICDWLRLKEKGIKICKSISALELYTFQDKVYPKALGSLTKTLLEALNGLKDVLEGVEIINKQLKAVTQLHSSNEQLINTWTAEKISSQVNKLYQSLLQEYQLKQYITENIGHCRDEKLTEVYVSSWEFDVYFDINDTTYLFADLGLSNIAL